VNSAYFRGIVPEYLNPAIETVRSPQGYALSHYAGNVNLFATAKPLALKEVEGGLAGTILAGEVSAEFKPWGDPTNLRDPILGINSVPGGFGSPSQMGANFVFLDGSVRSVRSTTDPNVLRKMSTPAFATDLPGRGPQ
jgi:prepilin-type processing-associated H-X9-DG protein